VPRIGDLEYRFPAGCSVSFRHLQHETTKLDWQGAQIPLIIFDELTHFTKSQFFYMLSRNRSMCGVKPYIRATCNPDADSWVAEFIAWWIDPATGYPIPERAGKLRWFIRINDTLVWADTREELIAQYGVPGLPDDDEQQVSPKSVTFIPGKLSDNPALMKADPGYLANLRALPLVEQQRLLGGNWKIRPSSGMYFKRSWCEIVDAVPASAIKRVRYWDLAATEKTQDNDPDWTVGVRMAHDKAAGLFYIEHVERLRASPARVEATIKNTASADGKGVKIGVPQDPGQAGKAQAQYFVKQLVGFSVSYDRESGDKVTRFGPFSSQAQAGNVKIVRGAWNEDFFSALEAFPDALHDDDPDACSGAFTMLTGGPSMEASVSPLRA
jgi:predicted phage terminase large subunit-like protein